MICPKCGTQLYDNSTVCMFCNTPIQRNQQQTVGQQNQQQANGQINQQQTVNQQNQQQANGQTNQQQTVNQQNQQQTNGQINQYANGQLNQQQVNGQQNQQTGSSGFYGGQADQTRNAPANYGGDYGTYGGPNPQSRFGGNSNHVPIAILLVVIATIVIVSICLIMIKILNNNDTSKGEKFRKKPDVVTEEFEPDDTEEYNLTDPDYTDDPNIAVMEFDEPCLEPEEADEE